MKSSLLVCWCIVIMSCNSGKESGMQILLTNTSGIDLVDKAIIINRDKLKVADTDLMYPVIKGSEGENIPAQLDDLNGDSRWDELFFVVSLPANGQAAYSLSWAKTETKHSPRASVRFGKRSSMNTPVEEKQADTLYPDQLPKKLGYQPFQTDGPSWENDKVAFRHYLDGRNAKDLFAKRVPAISLEKVGLTSDGAVEDNYHVLEPWGRDILEVGNSAGLGGTALMVDGQYQRLGVTVNDSINNVERTIYRTVAKGPVRSILSFDYKDWHTSSGRVYDVHEKSVIWPGMYAFQSTYRINKLKGDEALVVGLVNSNTDHPLTEITAGDKWVILMTHDKQTYKKEYWLGLALILPKDVYIGSGEAPDTGRFSKSYYGKLKISNDHPVSYYAVGASELSDPNFKDSTYFSNYVQKLAAELAAEVKIEIK